jgi:Spy/CpxP family protein refolding chaperone
MGPGGGEEAMIARILTNPKAAETLGLSEEQVKALREKLDNGRKEMETLRVDLEKASVEQAHLLTATQAVDEAAVMAAVEKAGEIRTKIAKLAVQQLLIVKKTLTPEQIEKARTVMRERLEKARQQEIGGARGDQGDGAGSRRRPRDRGGRGHDEGQPGGERGEKPPPPPEKVL